MENVRETVELVFKTSLEGTRTVRIPNPVEIITQPMINTAISRLILSNPFDETIGNLVDLLRAERVTVSRTVLLPEPA